MVQVYTLYKLFGQHIAKGCLPVLPYDEYIIYYYNYSDSESH